MKIVGVAFVVVGLLLLSLGVGPVFDMINGTLPLPEINRLYFSVGGVVLVILGVLFFGLGGEKRIKNEVPIYHKKKNQIVGYRRMK